MSFNLFFDSIPLRDSFFLIATLIIIAVTILVLIVYLITSVIYRFNSRSINIYNDKLLQLSMIDSEVGEYLSYLPNCPYIESSHMSYKAYGPKTTTNLKNINFSNNKFGVMLQTSVYVPGKITIDSVVEDIDLRTIEYEMKVAKVKTAKIDEITKTLKSLYKLRVAAFRLGQQPKMKKLTMKHSISSLTVSVRKSVIVHSGENALNIHWCNFVNAEELAQAKKAQLRKNRPTSTQSASQSALANQSINVDTLKLQLEKLLQLQSSQVQTADSNEQPISINHDDIERELIMQRALSYEEAHC